MPRGKLNIYPVRKVGGESVPDKDRTDPTQAADDATVEVTWCLDQELFDLIGEREIPKPLVLFSVVQVRGTGHFDRTETKRYLADVRQATKFISFSRSGPNLVFATLVWDEGGDLERLESLLMAKNTRGEYLNDVLTYSFDGFQPVMEFDKGEVGHFEVEDSIEVNVDPNTFAKPPRPWVKAWTGRFWKNQAVRAMRCPSAGAADHLVPAHLGCDQHDLPRPDAGGSRLPGAG